METLHRAAQAPPASGPGLRTARASRASSSIAAGVAIALVLFACLAPIGCRQDTGPPQVPGALLPIEYLRVGEHRITAEVAYTDASRRRGLMFREEMPEDHGMLFVYGEDGVLTFWMKDTRIPLSIAFADAEGRILRIADMQPFSEERHSSLFPVRYALEMRQGWFQRNGVAAGDTISELPQVAVE